MKRRNFLRTGSLAGLAIGSIALASAESEAEITEKNQQKKNSYAADDFALNELTIDELQKKMQSGEYTSRTLTTLYLKRIEAMDRKGINLRAVIELNPEALSIADAMDVERQSNKIRGPLHGIPVLIKDNINTGDQMMTTAGSLALEGNKATKDAFIIKQLREAGAVLLGKTNLSEWANFRSTRSVSGWSSRGGQTKNPIELDRNPSGSSSGSGAAVAANFCAVAIGTETDGSVTAPASCCGIVGIKPTVGLLSRSGIIPISKTQDTAGPMARTVRDAAILLGALTGIDSDDPATNESNGKSFADYTKFLNATGLKGKRIGIEKSFLAGNPSVVELYQQAIALMKKNGATLVQVELLSLTAVLSDAEYLVLQYEFKDGLNKYLSSTKVKSLQGVITFNKQNPLKCMPYFKQEILELSAAKGGLDTKEYTDALANSLSARKLIDDLMKRNKLDAIAGTTCGPACCVDLVNGDYDTGANFCSPAAMAGYPHITVPMGKVQNLPIGLSFISGAYRENVIIEIAYAFEQTSKSREMPKFFQSGIPE